MFKTTYSAVFALSLSVAGAAQSPAPAPSATPQLSPQAAYDQALTPFEITRRSIQNWSDSEVAAFSTAIHDASVACRARSPEQFAGDDLIAFARLCALGQQWPVVDIAATRYIDADTPSKPLLTRAFALQIDAAFNLKDEKHGLAASSTMLTAVPYDLTVDQATQEALHYMQLAFTADALTLYAAREPYVLKGMSTPNAASAAPISRATLYADGLAYAALQKFAGYDDDAATTVRELDAALPTKLAPDEEIPIAASRQQYRLLGAKLPAIPLTASLFAEHETPRIDINHHSTSVLLLFPPWCAQCVRMSQTMMTTLARISEDDIRLYALLAQAPPPVAAPPKPEPRAARSKAAAIDPPATSTPKTAAELLTHTPTLIVPEATLTQFAATDFPLLIEVDSEGIVRFIQPAPETALNEGDFLDQVAAHIAAQWPAKARSK